MEAAFAAAEGVGHRRPRRENQTCDQCFLNNLPQESTGSCVRSGFHRGGGHHPDRQQQNGHELVRGADHEQRVTQPWMACRQRPEREQCEPTDEQILAVVKDEPGQSRG